MKQSLQLKLSQHLALTPQLQQSIRMLQLSTLDLNQEIEKLLLENPLLEREEGDPGEEAFDAASRETAESPWQDDTVPVGQEWTMQASSSRSDDDDGDFHDIQAAHTSLKEHLESQVALCPLSERDRMLALVVIEALDEDGYLHQSLDELIGLFPESLAVTEEELLIALLYVQNLDPPGVAARSPQECLSLQLQALPKDDIRDLADCIVHDHLDLLAGKNFSQLKKLTGCDDDRLRAAHALICSLDPHPGTQYSSEQAHYVLPDVIVRKQAGKWTVALNPNAVPRLKVNTLYADLLRENKLEGNGLASQLQEARWLIKNVQQRFTTILRVSQIIVDQQRLFFDHGEVAMRPLTLREIAEQLNLHESTVSRVTTQKYMATPRGVFELKYFFGSHVSTETGGAASSTAIRALIRQLVDAEDSKKPLSDAKIADLLGQQGIVVARRTIAKYRELLNIPPVSMRKTI